MKTKNALLCIFIGLLAFEVIILSRQNMVLKKRILLNAQSEGQRISENAVGSVVPPLSGVFIDNEKSMIGYQDTGQKTVLFVFSTECPQCLNIIPEWRMLSEQLKELKAVRVFGIVKGDVSVVRKYVSGYQLNYPVLIYGQDDETLKKGYGVQAVPTTMLVDQSGKVLRFYEGLMNQEKIDEMITSIKTE
jgi:peroxiredoxin